MLVTVRERLILQSILPQEGDFLTLKVLRQLKNALGFSEVELATYQLTQKDGQVTWDDSAAQVKEVEIGKKANEIIVQALRQLEEKKKLRDEHFDIYERFIKPDEAN